MLDTVYILYIVNIILPQAPVVRPDLRFERPRPAKRRPHTATLPGEPQNATRIKYYQRVAACPFKQTFLSFFGPGRDLTWLWSFGTVFANQQFRLVLWPINANLKTRHQRILFLFLLNKFTFNHWTILNMINLFAFNKMIDIMLNSAQMNLNAKVSVQSIQYYPFQWLHLQPNADAILFKVISI